ncbi:hypothetical protein HU200_012622 [Digitaria exilis]|uniref:NB-ARC domain-containing protein n=1 Tax=Digitaria exilis TaxID=1010633 RepID=A0A835FEM3_9POAL|nr:hypothetical protein HU200_012622 [Digitaria exilis]
MEILLSAILGDLTTRSMNFFISKLPKPAELDVENRLSRILLRAQVIISEAMGREITNLAMLQQLTVLTDSMHRGYYSLDTFRCQTQEEAKGHHSSLLSIVLDSVKDLCFPSGTSTQKTQREMQDVLDSLRLMIVDAHELVMFLSNYSCMYRQPFSMYLQLDNCMFGRQMEAQFVINFLLHRQPPCVEEPLEVLPIVGPFRVGKSTLVAHVCKDARVRDYFSQIVLLSDLDFRDEDLAAFRKGCATMKHRNSTSGNSYKDERRRLLLVVEAAGDLDEDIWHRLYSSSKRWMPRGSKIIITSRSNKIKNLGTTQALTLKHLSQEAYWYFFKTLAFGSTDPMPHPRLTSLAMEISKMMNGSMIIANVAARMLRDNFDVRFWSKFAAFVRMQFQRHVSKFGEHPYDLLNHNKPVYFGRIHRRSEQVIAYHKYGHYSSQEEVVPKITLHDVTYGETKLSARFEVLAWTSLIPPYYSYVYACEVQELEARATKRKRSE